jgi:tripartite-type tricarboxylate transporter receptor subunit TctC
MQLLFVAVTAAALTLATSATASYAAESSYPERPVRLIVPFPPGGANDIVARLIAQELQQRWGQPVVVDNRAGAGGNIGTDVAARATADGYTLLIGSGSTLGSNVGLYRKLPFDVATDFDPIALVVTAPFVLTVNPAVPARSVQELIELAKKRKLNYSSWGDGSTAHLITEMFKSMAGVEMLHVPYKGGAPALTAAITGEVQLTFSNMSVALPQVKAGKLEALAVTSRKRALALTDLPTIAESGLPDFEAEAWVGVVSPAGVPRSLIQRINEDLRAIVADPSTREAIMARGLEPASTTPEEFRRHIHAEIKRWKTVISEAGIARR